MTDEEWRRAIKAAADVLRMEAKLGRHSAVVENWDYDDGVCDAKENAAARLERLLERDRDDSRKNNRARG